MSDNRSHPYFSFNWLMCNTFHLNFNCAILVYGHVDILWPYISSSQNINDYFGLIVLIHLF